MKGEKLYNWIADSLQNAAAILAVCVIIFSVGVDMVFFLPARQRDAALLETRVNIDQSVISVNAMTDRVSEELPWLAKKYHEVPASKLQEAKNLLSDESENGARKFFALALQERNVKKSIALADLANRQVANANQIVKEVKDQLDNYQVLRAGVRNSLISVSQAMSATHPLQSAATSRLSEEKEVHLKKYTNSDELTLNQAGKKIADADQYLVNASAFMPADSDRSGMGDPTFAQEEIDRAKVLIDEINVLMSQVTADLDNLKNARELASQKVADAKSTYTQSKNYVDGLSNQTRFWLKDSYRSLAAAEKSKDAAAIALATVVEDGKVDLKLAYDSALSSISGSLQAVSSADAEIDDEQTARQGSTLITSRVPGVNTGIGQAIGAQSTMRLYHNASTWSNVSSNVITAQALVEQAIALAKRALELIEITVQKFAEGKTAASDGLNKLDQAQSLASTVVDVKSTLERFRSEWPGYESQAASVINNEQANVQNYGSYDMGAVNSFNTAVSQLNNARSHASSGYYQIAIEEANAAYANAYGTGSRAYQAYEAEMERQRQARIAATRQAEAAEQARQRAAEEAARRASQSSDYDYGGSSSSGSSCCSGGYSSGGSDYSGGGSDSNYGGGGSDSDY